MMYRIFDYTNCQHYLIFLVSMRRLFSGILIPEYLIRLQTSAAHLNVNNSFIELVNHGGITVTKCQRIKTRLMVMNFYGPSQFINRRQGLKIFNDNE